MSKTKCHPKFYQAICSTLTCQWMTIKVMILIVEKGSSQKDTNYFWSLPYTNFLLCDKKSFMKEAEINPHIMHDIFRSWLEVVRRGTIQWPWHRSGSQFLWSCQYFERLGTGRERERGGKGKSTQGSCSQARVTLASAQAAAFTYFPTLRLNLAQAFHSVSLMSRWTRRQVSLK